MAKKKSRRKLQNLFTGNLKPRQKQYEALRSLAFDEDKSYEEVAEQFGYNQGTLRNIENLALKGKIDFFPEIKRGPKEPQIPQEIISKIIKLRKQELSIYDIKKIVMTEDGEKVSIGSLQNILSKFGFDKLKRRTADQRGVNQKNLLKSKRATEFDLEDTEPFKIDLPCAGVFFFIPYIIETGILDIVKKCKLPESSDINSIQAVLSFLLLKLIGNERLSHIQQYDQEPAFGIFSGLNVLPKSTYISTYSCRTSKKGLETLQKETLKKFKEKYPEFYKTDYINLDFHSIPHFGEQSKMEKVWCGTRGKTMKGANTLLAQNGDSDLILYTKADILRKDESREIKNFIKYWKEINGSLDETLVFDCKVTKYEILDEINQWEEKVKFITLQKRSPKLKKEISEIPDSDWQKVHLDIPKRKYKDFFAFEREVVLNNCKSNFRQIIIKGHGRKNPTIIITNNWKLTLEEIIEIYAKRWHIENTIEELVSFFNLNALSSPIMVRIHFDIFWTMVANTIYYRFKQDLPRYEKCKAKTIFKKFIDFPGTMEFDGKKFTIKIRKRSHTPILLGVEKLSGPFKIPWLKNAPIEIIWTA